MDNLGKTTIYRFGDYLLNTSERNLFRGETPIEIPSKTFDVLHLLVEKGGETVTKNEILDAVWGESFVEEGNLPVHISKLRKFLGATKTEPLIKTVTGRGYQLVVPVQAVKNQAVGNKIPRAGESRELSLTPNFNPDSIAVLPLHNENGDEEIDYLADGITESLINSLSYMPDFRVLARDTVFRYKNIDVDAQGIGKVLGVATVLTGRLRVVRNTIVIAIELINVNDGTQVWGTQIKNHPISDIFALQDSLAVAISKQISDERYQSTAPRSHKPTENYNSYRLYLKARHLLKNKTLKNINLAIRYFQDSISFDPTNIQSFIGIGECYFWLNGYAYMSSAEALPLIRKTLSRVREINPQVPEYFYLKGNVARSFEWEFEKSKDLYRKALTLDSQHLDTLRAYSHVLALEGRYSESLMIMGKMKELEPVSTIYNTNAGRLFYNFGQYENALLEFDEAIELDPRNYVALALRGCTYIELAEYDKAIKALRRATEIQDHEEFETLIAYANARSGDIPGALKILKRIYFKSKSTYTPHMHFGIIYAGMGEVDKAFECLENAFIEREESITAIKINPRWAILRNDPRFSHLIKKIGLPPD